MLLIEQMIEILNMKNPPSFANISFFSRSESENLFRKLAKRSFLRLKNFKKILIFSKSHQRNNNNFNSFIT